MIKAKRYYVRNMTRTPDITDQDQEVANLVRSDIYTDYATHVAAYRIAIEDQICDEIYGWYSKQERPLDIEAVDKLVKTILVDH